MELGEKILELRKKMNFYDYIIVYINSPFGGLTYDTNF